MAPSSAQSHSAMCIRNIYGKMPLVRRKLSLIHWLLPAIMETERRALGSDPPVQYSYNKNHGKNLSSTSGEAEPFTQYSISFKIGLQVVTVKYTVLEFLNNLWGLGTE